VEEPRVIRLGDGLLTYVLNPPAVRRWRQYGDLADAEPADWSLTEDAAGARLSAADTGSEVDLLELGSEAARAFTDDRPEPLTAIPSFKPIGPARDLGEWFVAGRVLSGIERQKKPVESTSLSLYRIARLRGGPLWNGIAEHLASDTAVRIEDRSETRLVHDIWKLGETHTRYLNDAVLLMAAHAEWTGGERWTDACAQVCAVVDSFTVDAYGGRWVLHDSVERDAGRNDRVLNTQVQGILARLAAGRDIGAHLHATAAALSPRVASLAGLRSAAELALLETVRARGPRRYVRRRVSPVYTRASDVCTRAGAFRLPGGWIARDLSGKRRPPRYLTVNLGDMAALSLSLGATRTPPGFERWLTDGIRFARASGFFGAELRDGTPMATLIPTVLRLAGYDDHALHAADAARAAGLTPTVGWPGYTDHLWSRLGAGSPL
jgi:hypothetical protein